MTPELLKTAVAALTADLVDRDEAARLALLGALAEENVLLLGPPGTAKSLLARRLASLFDTSVFQYLLTRFTTPDELFGPVSVRALKDDDVFRRRTEGFLPRAEVVFLDEVFKASSAILNSLLTVLNERLFFNGDRVERCALRVLLAASNEVPAEEGLEALYDRFTLRLVVGGVGDDGAFRALLTGRPAAAEVGLRVPASEVQALRERAREVEASPAVVGALVDLRRRLQAAGVATPSDRRWRNALNLLRVCAAGAGRPQVELVDLAVLRHVCWSRPEERERVAAAVREATAEAASAVGPSTALEGPWRALLDDLARTPGVAEPLVEGWRVRVGERAVVLTDAELDGLRLDDWDVVLRTGLCWDPAVEAPWPLVRRTSTSFATTYGTVATQVELQLARRRRDLAREPGEVGLERRRVVGMRARMEGLHPLVRAAWLEEVRRLMALLEASLAAVEVAEAASEEGLRRHPFVGQAEGESLREGYGRARLRGAEWRARLAGLRGALDAGGAWATADRDLA